MTLKWLVAVLRPGDIAPHPNFLSEVSQYEPHEVLAAALTGDANRARVVRSFLAADPSTAPYVQAVRLAIETLDNSTIRTATPQLARLLTSEHFEPQVAGPLAVVAMAAAGELEDIELCEMIAMQTLTRLAGSDHSNRLIRACIQQQLALRRKDFNLDWVELCAEAASTCGRLLENYENLAIEPFPVSAGRATDAASAVRHVIIALQRAAWNLAPSFSLGETDAPFQEDFPTWQERVRAERAEQFLLTERHAANQYSMYVRDLFDSTYGNEAIVWGKIGPELFNSSLVYELYGSGQALASRKELALFRLLMSATGYAPTSHQDCLRLLRYSYSKKELRLTIAKIRNAGPLSELLADARQIIAHRLLPGRLRNVELQVLRGAADLLAMEEASDVFDKVVDLIRVGAPVNVEGHFEAYHTRIEESLRTAAALANVALRFEDLTSEFVSLLESLDYDELLDRSFARALNGLLWGSFKEDEVAIWSAWAARDSLPWIRTREIVRSNLGLRAYPVDGPIADLVAVADALNDSLRGHPANAKVLNTAPGLVAAELKRIRSDAAHGRYAGGGVNAAELAVLLIGLGAAELWEDLAALLVDPLVSREDKTHALERLADSDLLLPDGVTELFRRNAVSLLENAGSSFFTQDTLVPYPAALSCFARFNVLPPARVLIEVNRLAASSNAKSHVGAASCAIVLARSGKSEWIVPLSVQLTYNPDVAVVGRAARAVAHIVAEGTSPYTSLLSGRLAELVASDGVLVPLFVIRALADTEGSLTDMLRNALHEVAVSHASSIVRTNATDLLEAS